MSITIPEPWLMLLVFAVFIITMLLLNTWLFKPMLGFMDERESLLRKDMDSVSDNHSEIQEIECKIQAILADAKSQASKIIESATNDAKADYDAKIARKQQEMQQKMSDFRADLESQKAQIKKELLADLSVFESALKSRIQQI
ncbi:hypothetical protein BKN38_07635 [Helicobacter sp. CLO-3]|uniref:F0F1 ATP synthase subunit B family protein n=1 Tax=unclassified Helicobacter TaxID=2593540 RepID=UPI0008052C7A|nr:MULTISPECIES: hypothetical protein [unclassified Helicobacter]OBV29338.1 hypothetical protein BA723_05910 [Helicobacter sp. CLO-3]OHU82120.1 hypothetical protein BKN38_07635 [Helicobacter sp. CLO-3]